MKIILILLLPFYAFAQNTTVIDSVVVNTPAGATIRYVVPASYVPWSNTDSLIGRGTSSKRRTLVSPYDLPISTAEQTALNLKANTSSLSSYLTTANAALTYQPIGSYQAAGNYVLQTTTVNGHALSGNVSVTATDIGLGNVTNTSDANKPISTAQQTALDLKANLISPAFTTPALGTPSSGNLANCTFPTLNQNTSGSAGSVTNSLTIGAELISGGQTTYNGSAAKTLGIQSSSVTNAMLAGSIAYSKLSLTGAILNADLAGSIAYSKLSLTGAILNADLAGSIAYSKLSLTGAILNADLAGSIDLATKVTGVLPFANGGMGSTAATSATTGTISCSMTTQTITCTPTGAMTLNGTGGVTGERTTFVFTTSGVSSFVITFGTNFKSTGTLSTGTTSGKVFTVSFIYNGTSYLETGRTTAM